ncbi:hypothetical protein [Sphingomonas sanguinis]|uniref:hypothetical protein n=2 Tax=Sphingomonas sanguinis TaxID=33051 RepID=UPI00301AC20A
MNEQGPAMDRAAIEATFEANEKLIRRRALKAGAKALTIGTESLADTIDAIADAYALTGAQRRQLEPGMAIEAQEIAAKLKGFVGPAALLGDLRGGSGLLSQARAAGKLAKTARRIGKGGLAAGRVAARGGRVARAVPWAALGVAAWGVGNGGWFWWRAHAYNRACRDLLLGQQGGVVQPA